MPFTPTGYVPQYGDRIAELLMRQGEIAARGAERSGMIWGRAIENLGQIAGNAVENYQQQKILKQKDEGIYSVMQSWDGQDPTVLVKGLATYIGPIEAVKVAGGLQKLQEAKQVPQLDASHIAGPVGALAALERSSPGHLQRNWGLIFPQIEGLAKQAGLPVAPEWSEDMTKGVMTLDQQFNPPKAASAPPFQEVNGQGFERGPQGWAPAPGLPTATPKPEKTLADIEAESEARARGTRAGNPPDPQAPDEALPLTPAGIEMAARRYLKDGTLPPMGMGKAGAGTRKEILNRAAEIDPEADIASNVAAFGADKGSLASMQKQRDAIGAFEETAKKNIDIFLEQAGKVVDTGSPLANTLVRQVSGSLLGSKDIPAFNAARQVAVNEIAKITSNPTLAGQLSDSARHEVEAFNPANATLAQSVAVMRLLKRDMDNRKMSLDNGLREIKDRISGKKSGAKKIYFDAQGNMVGGQ